MLDEPRYLTTREVAALLRVKERKVYELTAAEAIPYRRVTGKLLFPRKEIVAWLNGEASEAAPSPPPVITGSHDPLLDWALRESGSGLAALCDGSLDGLQRFVRGEAVGAALHLPEGEGWNVETVAEHAPPDAVLLGFSVRTQGLIHEAARTGPLSRIDQLSGHRIALRQAGSGARAVFDRMATEAGVTDALAGSIVTRTETDAAAAVRGGDADVALGLEAVARQFGLDFAPLVSERFDLILNRRAYFEQPLQRLFAFCSDNAFAAKAAALGGYDVTPLGAVRWLSP